MKTLIATAGLALALLSGTAEAQPIRGGFDSGYRAGVRHEMALRNRDFGRGNNIYGRQVLVTDWWRHGLHRPSFRSHWERSGNRFLLISDRNGRVLDVVVAGRFAY